MGKCLEIENKIGIIGQRGENCVLPEHNALYSEQLKEILNGSDQQIRITKQDSFELIYCNEAALKAYGKNSHDYEGVPCYKFLAGRESNCPYCPYLRMKDTDTEARIEICREDGYYGVYVKKLEFNGEKVQIEYVTDLTQTKKALNETNEYLDIMNELANSGMWYYHYDEQGNQLGVVWNDKIREILGYRDIKDFPNSFDAFWTCVHPEDKSMLNDVIQASLNDSNSYDIRYRVIKKDGSIIWVDEKGKCVRYPNGAPRLLFGTLADITEQRRGEELSLIIQALARDYLDIYLLDEETGIAKIQKRDGSYASKQFNEMGNTFIYNDAWKLYVKESVHEEDAGFAEKMGSLDRIVEMLKTKDEYSFNYRSISDGVRYFQVKYIRLDKNRTIVAFRNVDDIIKLQEKSKLLHKVERDILTGLYNKESFCAYAQEMFDSHPDESFDMVCLEIESYQMLLNRYGRENCDAFVNALAGNLNRSEEKNVLIGRMDENQFAVFKKHIPFDRHKQLFYSMCKLVSSLTSIPGIKINCGIYENANHTYGIPLIYSNARMPIEDLRDHYDHNIALFDDNDRAALFRAQQIKSAAPMAIRNKQFKVFYQPKHDAFSEKVRGAEALVRWTHPELGFISPGDFIPIFENNGFIVQLDTYVVETVCDDLRRMISEGKNVVPVSINISQVDFDHEDLADKLQDIVNRYGISHDLIHFEVTESANARDTWRKEEAVKKFKEKGFSVEIDDFGSGYSNLATLGIMPVDVMKIDISLIRNITQSKYRTIVNIILMGAQGLGISAVAEGVETEEQLDILRSMCKDKIDLLIQGFYYSKALPVSEYEIYVSDRC